MGDCLNHEDSLPAHAARAAVAVARRPSCRAAADWIGLNKLLNQQLLRSTIKPLHHYKSTLTIPPTNTRTWVRSHSIPVFFSLSLLTFTFFVSPLQPSRLVYFTWCACIGEGRKEKKGPSCSTSFFSCLDFLSLFSCFPSSSSRGKST